MARLIIGAMVRALGAYPSGWRYPGAHRDPRGDAGVLRLTARLAERARLDHLFFGDWLSTGPELAHRDPYLLARIDPLSAVAHLAAVTERIGLVATVDSSYADPYSVARATASIDLLSGGRVGLNLVTTADARAAGNHGLDAERVHPSRYERAVEFETVLKRLWDSFDDGAIVADASTGDFLDPEGVHEARFRGTHLRVDGALNAVRPVQGHPPIIRSGASPASRLIAARSADLALVAADDLAHAVAVREELRALAFESGRDDRTLKVIAPVLPIVAETRAGAQAIADELSELVRLVEDWPDGPPSGFPAERSLASLSPLVGVDLQGVSPDLAVTPAIAAQFGQAGQQLVEIVAERTGRTPAGLRPPTLRHLVVAAAVTAPIIVGTADDVATEFEAWGEAGAVDGFNVLSAVQPSQFEAFTSLVAPELQRRGLLPRAYEGTTLREHLGLGRPDSVHSALGALHG
ncbi:NtaA/DmoA family FMN-dependent monooxygenase [Agromyces soli]|uniref:NtaA/DmoA family FMN-dependent monooxygenase n=1 Tax=Agromyces soli TaxID=659012 RepID=A0ABY4ATX0_9MICO|nr:NtaA/DmoA family FMN-dependent monooxygenase [Agromyces soli]UOE26573.1 NtaA/DmoA family FMN-dependent monooxygenase [Agromyces soli]